MNRMPPKRITILPAGQGTISVFFKKPAKAVEPVEKAPTIIKPVEVDNEIQRFYNSLTEKEKIAHAIAVEKLGSSYDVTRTHGFLTQRK